MNSLTSPRATVADYMNLPEGAPYQLIGGALVCEPAPTVPHQRISTHLIVELSLYLRRHRLGEAFAAPIDVILADDEVYQPDIVVIINDRKEIVRDRIYDAPDLVIEILSPSTAYYDLIHKKKIYAQSGVYEYWIVDPVERTVDVYSNREGEFLPRLHLSDEGSVRSEVLRGFRLGLQDIFDH